MILAQSLSSDTVIRQALPDVGVVTTLIQKSVSATTTPGVFYDAETSSVSNVTTWNEAQIAPSVPLDAAADYESLTPSIATVSSDGYVTRVANGVAKIKATMNGGATVQRVDVSQAGGQTFTEFTGFVSGSISDLALSALTDAMTPGTTLPFFSSYNVAPSTFTPSATCWAKDIITSMAVATDITGSWSTANRGAPITTRHHVGAYHWNVSSPTAGNGYVIGTKIRYRGASGTIYERTVIGVANWNDLVIATLNEALPADVTPLPLVGEWIFQDRADSALEATGYFGGAAFFVDQFFNVKGLLLSNPLYKKSFSTETAIVNGTTYTQAVNSIYGTGYVEQVVAEKSGYFGQGISGDSGSAVELIASGTRCILFTFLSPLGGAALFNDNGALVNSLIEAADADASVSTGLTVTVAPDPTA